MEMIMNVVVCYPTQYEDKAKTFIEQIRSLKDLRLVSSTDVVNNKTDISRSFNWLLACELKERAKLPITPHSCQFTGMGTKVPVLAIYHSTFIFKVLGDKIECIKCPPGYNFKEDFIKYLKDEYSRGID